MSKLQNEEYKKQPNPQKMEIGDSVLVKFDTRNKNDPMYKP